MASTLVKSLRILPEIWAKVEAYAAAHDLSVNGAAVQLLAWAVEEAKKGIPET